MCNQLFTARWLLLVLSSCLLTLVLCDGGTVSIEKYSVYQNLRGCAQCCFRECNARCWFIVGDIISCGHGDTVFCGNDAQDSCFCRADLQPAVTTYISECVYSSCSSNLNDMTSAVNAYTEYCKSTGQVLIPSPTGIPTTTDEVFSSSAKTSRPTSTLWLTGSGSAPSSTSPSATGDAGDASKTDGGGLSKDAIIAIVVGVVSIVIAAITLCIMCVR